MNERPKRQKVYIVDGLKRIREVTAEIHVCEKMTWARYLSGIRSISKRLGTTAFFTRHDAEVRKLGELRKLAAKTYPLSHIAGHRAEIARGYLSEYARTGRIH